MSGTLEMWTIYDHPTDFPGEYVARRFNVTSFGPAATDMLIRGKTLDEVRHQLLVTGLVAIQRDPSDDPKIVETRI